MQILRKLLFQLAIYS